MKLLLAGDWHSDIHEGPLARALAEEGVEVIEFRWAPYFSRNRGRMRRLLGLAQDRWAMGTAVGRLNRDLLRLAARARPDVVLVYRGTHVWPQTLRSLRAQNGSFMVGLNNDDPFSPQAPKGFWRHFLRGLSSYDLLLAYRKENVRSFGEAGAKNVELCRSWFLPDRHRPVTLSAAEQLQWGSDVCFIGHYEPDGRVESLEELVKAGIRVRLFGPDWKRGLRRSEVLRSLGPVQPVWGEDYNRALNGAKIVLSFLSKLNRDGYTRRCFEIPAAKRFMLAEHSTEMELLFREGQEAEFFRSPSELVRKAQHFLHHPEEREAIAAAGHRRVWEDGHDVHSRARQILRWLHDARDR